MLLVIMLLAVVLLVLVVTVGVVHITGVKARRLSPFKVPVVTTGDYVGNISICVGETRHVWAGRGEDDWERARSRSGQRGRTQRQRHAGYM